MSKKAAVIVEEKKNSLNSRIRAIGKSAKQGNLFDTEIFDTLEKNVSSRERLRTLLRPDIKATSST